MPAHSMDPSCTCQPAPHGRGKAPRRQGNGRDQVLTKHSIPAVPPAPPPCGHSPGTRRCRPSPREAQEPWPRHPALRSQSHVTCALASDPHNPKPRPTPPPPPLRLQLQVGFQCWGQKPCPISPGRLHPCSQGPVPHIWRGCSSKGCKQAAIGAPKENPQHPAAPLKASPPGPRACRMPSGHTGLETALCSPGLGHTRSSYHHRQLRF